MYENEPTAYGYRMTFGGFMDKEEMEAWASEVRTSLARTPAVWHCYVDMRQLRTMSEEGQRLMSEVKRDCHDQGLRRVATLVESPTVRLQFEQMSDGTGGSEMDRYLDTQTTDAPEQAAVEWVRDGVEPRN